MALRATVIAGCLLRNVGMEDGVFIQDHILVAGRSCGRRRVANLVCCTVGCSAAFALGPNPTIAIGKVCARGPTFTDVANGSCVWEGFCVKAVELPVVVVSPRVIDPPPRAQPNEEVAVLPCWKLFPIDVVVPLLVVFVNESELEFPGVAYRIELTWYSGSTTVTYSTRMSAAAVVALPLA